MSIKRMSGLALLAAGSMGAYLLASQLTLRAGFPLDDAWIHQTYARNLATLGEWSFLPGEPSAGSTSPLWGGILAVGYALSFNPLVWTFALGWFLLTGLAALGGVATGLFCTGRNDFVFWGAFGLVFEWHLVWAAGSGMETLAFTLAVTLVLVWIAGQRENWFWLGALIGLSGWLRPDGITLLAPAGVGILAALLKPHSARSAVFSKLFRLVSGFGMLFLPYLFFNQALAGEFWPNTFYAKQAEYAVLGQSFFGSRLLAELGLPLVGVGSLLLPGVLLFFAKIWKSRNWGTLAGLLWWLGYAALYAWRLPVVYQHGRYMIPAMPIFFIWGIAGLLNWTSQGVPRPWRRVTANAWKLSTLLVLIGFWLAGARAYGLDVAFIENEMVATAKWIAQNTAPDVVVAAHDIGALGYFGERKIIDLAGLVSPDVVVFIRDEARLKSYLDNQKTDYLMTLEGWYPELEAPSKVVYTSSSAFAHLTGGSRMILYRWGPP